MSKTKDGDSGEDGGGGRDFVEGDAVQFRRGGEGSWRDGVVKLVRKDRTLDIVDGASDEVLRKVPLEDVRSGKAPKKSTKSGKKEDESAPEEWVTGDRVEFEDKGGVWHRGRIKRRRRDGTFDVAHESDDEVVEKGVAPASIRRRRATKSKTKDSAVEEGGGEDKKKKKPKKEEENEEEEEERRGEQKKKTKKKKMEEEEEEEEEERTSVRRRKSADPRRTKSDDSDDKEDDDENDDKRRHHRGTRRRSPPSNGRRGRPVAVAFAQLRTQQLVDFDGPDGRVHRGRIKLLRRDEETCDVEHESDPERISKRLGVDVVRPVSMLRRLWGHGPWLQPNPNAFQLNARVFYPSDGDGRRDKGRDDDDDDNERGRGRHRIGGTERKGFVIKIWRDKDGVTYDIEDELDGEITRRVPGRRLRPVPWLNYALPAMSLPTVSLPSVSLPAMPSLFPAPMLRKGLRVRVRRRDADSGRVQWADGVIVRTKSDGTCLVELDAKARGDEDQDATTIQVKNADIQAKFTSPFTGLLPSIQFQLPRGLYPPKSCVEVMADGGGRVHLGTVTSVQESARTYTIQYEDGRREKHVAAERVRLSLRRLRIGTEVEMIVEGPCKEVSKLDGEVAWVHRNEKVAVRIHGGNNDVFAEVCTHALMVDGQPAFSAPLSSTWVELVGFYLNLLLEALIFLWLCFGLVVELGEMLRVLQETSPSTLNDPATLSTLYQRRDVNWPSCQNPLPRTTLGTNTTMTTILTRIPDEVFATDRAWLVALVIVKSLLTAACVGCACRLVHSKILAIQDNFIDVKEYQQDRVLRRYFSRLTGWTLVVSAVALLVYASLLNRLEWLCLFQPTRDVHFDALAQHANVFAVHTAYATPVDLVLGLAAKSLFNLWRATALYLLVFAFPASGVGPRLLGLVPAVACTALVGVATLAGLHVFYRTQRRELVEHGHLELTTTVDWAIVVALTGLWLAASLGRLATAAGASVLALGERRQAAARESLTDDVLDQAERGEFGLQAKREALYVRVERRQEQLGLCKLGLLRLDRQGLAHVGVMVLGIVGDGLLLGATRGHGDRADEANALITHLVLCCLWLVISVVAALLALGVKREIPELLAHILDV